MSLLNTKTARSMIYLVCIGGLLVCNAWIVMIIWNTVLWPMTPSTIRLNFLEGAGLTAFAYVIVFTVRYGRKVTKAPSSHADSSQRSHPATSSQHSELSALCSSMTADEKSRLKSELASRAGCKEEMGRE